MTSNIHAFNGMLHVDPASYANVSLTDGSLPALEYFLRCIEWAGKGL